MGLWTISAFVVQYVGDRGQWGLRWGQTSMGADISGRWGQTSVQTDVSVTWGTKRWGQTPVHWWG